MVYVIKRALKEKEEEIIQQEGCVRGKVGNERVAKG